MKKNKAHLRKSILLDICRGLSQEEISIKRGISLSQVEKELKYLKDTQGAKNLPHLIALLTSSYGQIKMTGLKSFE